MIVYLHGFNSAGSGSSKAAALKEAFTDVEVLAPDYPSNDPDTAIAIVSELMEGYVATSPVQMLVGSSMGGYFAQFLARKFGVKIVLINPAIDPATTLRRCLGENTHHVTGQKFILTEENLAALKKYDIHSYTHEFGTLILLDKGDEVIDWRVAFGKYEDCADCHVFEDGNHRFAHMEQALPLIRDYYYLSSKRPVNKN